MSRRKLYTALTGVFLVTAVSLALVFGVFQGQPDVTTGADIANEDIQVHGHWTIEVREPDGQLVSRHEFDNALVQQLPLTRILAGIWTSGLWGVVLIDFPVTNSPCRDDSGNPRECRVVETDSWAPVPYRFETLTVTVPDTGPNDDKIVLTGTATPTGDGTISYVQTQLTYCTPDVAPDSCTRTVTALAVTSTPLSPAIDVVSGQQILVEVVISFQ